METEYTVVEVNSGRRVGAIHQARLDCESDMDGLRRIQPTEEHWDLRIFRRQVTPWEEDI